MRVRIRGRLLQLRVLAVALSVLGLGSRRTTEILSRCTVLYRRLTVWNTSYSNEATRIGRSAVGMVRMPVDARHRDKNGEMSRKHGNTLIRTLRKTYGPGFAKDCADDEKLSDALHKLDEPSLSHLVRDHDAGKLEQIAGAGKGAADGDERWPDALSPDDPDNYMSEADEGSTQESRRYSIEFPGSSSDVEKP